MLLWHGAPEFRAGARKRVRVRFSADQYGKAKCTRAVAESQSASCSERKVEPKTEAATAVAGQERFLRRASAGRPVDRRNVMRKDLPALAAKITTALSIRPEYLVTQPAELRILQGMSEDEIRQFAASHGWRVIRRLGGRQIEFYNDAGARAL
jgi:hypothetical protein